MSKIRDEAQAVIDAAQIGNIVPQEDSETQARRVLILEEFAQGCAARTDDAWLRAEAAVALQDAEEVE